MNKKIKNRLLIILLCLALIAPHVISRNYEYALASQKGEVTASSLNVRTEPSTSSKNVNVGGTRAYLTRGETVEIIGQDGDWYNIYFRFNGKRLKGYVHGDYIKTEATVKPTPKPTAKPTPKPTAKPTAKPTPKPSNGNTSGQTNDLKVKGEVTASSLNVRSGPGTSFPVMAGLRRGSKVTMVGEEIDSSKTKWYEITYQSGGSQRKGYVSSLYIKIDFSDKVLGVVTSKNTRIRNTASSKGAYVKKNDGSIISLKKDKKVTILDEKTVSGSKWLEISFKLSGDTYSGFVPINNIGFRNKVADPTPEPTATPKPTGTPKATKAPKPTDVPEATPVPTAKPTPTAKPKPTPTPKPTPVPTKAPEPTMVPEPVEILVIPDMVIMTGIYSPLNAFVCNTEYLNVYKNILVSDEYLTDVNGEPILIISGMQVTANKVVRVNGVPYYEISVDDDITGHVKAEYIYIGNTLPDGIENPYVPGTKPITPKDPGGKITPTPTPSYEDNLDFEFKLINQGFPESYKEGLRQLHKKHPNWEFVAYHTNLDWNTVIREESLPGKNTIPNSKSVEWLSFQNGAYNWSTDKFIVYDGSYWVTASKEAIEYYMDPRNFLNEREIFQFELLRYQSEYQNRQGVENILRGTAMHNTTYDYADDSGKNKTISYGKTFIDAAKYSGVSPYHLASRVKQEVVTGPNTLSNSVSGTYKGYEGYYNFYNIGANDSPGGGAIANGLRYAMNGTKNPATNAKYMIPWTSRYKSIVGGSYFIGSSYIHRGQDTVYLQKFNVTPVSTYFHQYMTNVEAPWAEARKIAAAYSNMDDAPIVFSIPVYLNMPKNPASRPTKKYNPNNRLKSLELLDGRGKKLELTPSFSQTELNYSIFVDSGVDMVEVKAKSVSNKASVFGEGKISLVTGVNKIVVPVIAENGDVAEYKINIVKE